VAMSGQPARCWGSLVPFAPLYVQNDSATELTVGFDRAVYFGSRPQWSSPFFPANYPTVAGGSGGTAIILTYGSPHGGNLVVPANDTTVLDANGVRVAAGSYPVV
jgi:hypothetical protein